VEPEQLLDQIAQPFAVAFEPQLREFEALIVLFGRMEARERPGHRVAVVEVDETVIGIAARIFERRRQPLSESPGIAVPLKGHGAAHEPDQLAG
jgi:hypothetical protein